MSWEDDVPAARAGDAAARARVEEVLAPLAHVALLLRQPREVAARGVLEVLDDVWASLPADDGALGAAILERARRRGGSAPRGRAAVSALGHTAEPDATRSTVLEHLGSVSVEQKELLLLRLAYGYTFPQIGRLLGQAVPTLRQRFEAEAALVLELTAAPASDLEYLWGGDGRASLVLARLETQLTKLRCDLQPLAQERWRSAAQRRHRGGPVFDEDAPTELETRAALAERVEGGGRGAPTRKELPLEGAPPPKEAALRAPRARPQEELEDSTRTPVREDGARAPAGKVTRLRPARSSDEGATALRPASRMAGAASEAAEGDERRSPPRRLVRFILPALGVVAGVSTAWAVLALWPPPRPPPELAVSLARDVEALERLGPEHLTTAPVEDPRVAAQVLLVADAGSPLGVALPAAWARGELLPKALLEVRPRRRWEALTLDAQRSLRLAPGDAVDLLVRPSARSSGGAGRSTPLALARGLRVVATEEVRRRRHRVDRATLLVLEGERRRLEAALRGARWELVRSAGPATAEHEAEAEVLLRAGLLRERLERSAASIARLRAASVPAGEP